MTNNFKWLLPVSLKSPAVLTEQLCLFSHKHGLHCSNAFYIESIATNSSNALTHYPKVCSGSLINVCLLHTSEPSEPWLDTCTAFIVEMESTNVLTAVSQVQYDFSLIVTIRRVERFRWMRRSEHDITLTESQQKTCWLSTNHATLPGLRSQVLKEFTKKSQLLTVITDWYYSADQTDVMRNVDNFSNIQKQHTNGKKSLYLPWTGAKKR